MCAPRVEPANIHTARAHVTPLANSSSTAHRMGIRTSVDARSQAARAVLPHRVRAPPHLQNVDPTHNKEASRPNGSVCDPTKILQPHLWGARAASVGVHGVVASCAGSSGQGAKGWDSARGVEEDAGAGGHEACAKGHGSSEGRGLCGASAAAVRARVAAGGGF
eukprot:3876168-Rhodomonas_salina.1